MGIVNKRRRHNVICQKHKRQEKIRKLRARLQGADSRTRDAIREKLEKYHAKP